MRLIQLPSHSYNELQEYYKEAEQRRWKKAEHTLLIFTNLMFASYWIISGYLIYGVIKKMFSPYCLLFSVVDFVLVIVFLIGLEFLFDFLAKKSHRTIGNLLNCEEFKDLMLLTKAAEELSELQTEFQVENIKTYLSITFRFHNKDCSISLPKYPNLVKENYLDFSVLNDEIESFLKMIKKEVSVQ